MEKKKKSDLVEEHKKEILDIFQLTNILIDQTNFEIFILLLINGSMKLSEIDIILKKSKATLHRHLKSMEDINLIKIVKQQPVRGHIPANYYSINMEKLTGSGHFTAEQIMQFSDLEKEKFNLGIRDSLITIAAFMNNMLSTLQTYLKQLSCKPMGDFEQLFNTPEPKLLLNFSLLSEEQKNLYLKRFYEFSIAFYKEIAPDGILETESEKPYALFTGLFPIKQMIMSNQDASKDTHEDKF